MARVLAGAADGDQVAQPPLEAALVEKGQRPPIAPSLLPLIYTTFCMNTLVAIAAGSIRA